VNNNATKKKSEPDIKKGASKIDLILKKSHVILSKNLPKGSQQALNLGNYDMAPSMIITSKNKTKEVSLIGSESIIRQNRRGHFETIMENEGKSMGVLERTTTLKGVRKMQGEGTKSNPATRHNLPKIKMNKPYRDNFITTNTNINTNTNTNLNSHSNNNEDNSVTIHVIRKDNSTNSRNLIREGVQNELLPQIIPIKTNPRKDTDADSVLSINSDQIVKGSTNIKLPINSNSGQNDNGQTININIKSVSINSPIFTSQYENQAAGTIISSIPKHDKSPAFRKLFAQQEKIKQETLRQQVTHDRIIRKPQFEHKRTRSTLEDLMHGGFIPMNVKEYLISCTKKVDSINQIKRTMKP